MPFGPAPVGTKNYTDADGIRRRLPPGEDLPEGAVWGWGGSQNNVSRETSAPLDTEPDFESPYEAPKVVPGSLRDTSEVTHDGAFKPKSWRERMRGKNKPGPSQPKPERSRSVFHTDSQAPKRPSKKRASAAEDFGEAWGWLGARFAQNPVHKPSGTMMQFSAPIAGEILDDGVAGTAVDRIVIQPAVAMRSRLDGVAGLIAPIAIVRRMETHPKEIEQLMPFLKGAIKRSLPFYVPAIKKAEARAKREMEALEALAPELLEIIDPRTGRPFTDPVDGVIAMIFEGWQPVVDSEDGVISEPETSSEGVPA
jgi:hypothetical protein